MLSKFVVLSFGEFCYQTMLWFDCWIDEILKVNDAVTMAMSQYMTRVQGMVDANGETEGAGKGELRLSAYMVFPSFCLYLGAYRIYWSTGLVMCII